MKRRRHEPNINLINIGSFSRAFKMNLGWIQVYEQGKEDQ